MNTEPTSSHGRAARKSFTRSGISRITSKGQITIPTSLRLALGLQPGDQVLMRLQDDASFLLTRLAPIEEVIARLPKTRLNMRKNWRLFEKDAERELARQAVGLSQGDPEDSEA